MESGGGFQSFVKGVVEKSFLPLGEEGGSGCHHSWSLWVGPRVPSFVADAEEPAGPGVSGNRLELAAANKVRLGFFSA